MLYPAADRKAMTATMASSAAPSRTQPASGTPPNRRSSSGGGSAEDSSVRAADADRAAAGGGADGAGRCVVPPAEPVGRGGVPPDWPAAGIRVVDRAALPRGGVSDCRAEGCAGGRPPGVAAPVPAPAERDVPALVPDTGTKGAAAEAIVDAAIGPALHVRGAAPVAAAAAASC